MSGRHQPMNGADAPDSAVTYRVPLRSLDSDHTFHRDIKVLGPRGMPAELDEVVLQRLLDDLKVQYPDYSVGTPRAVEE